MLFAGVESGVFLTLADLVTGHGVNSSVPGTNFTFISIFR